MTSRLLLLFVLGVLGAGAVVAFGCASCPGAPCPESNWFTIKSTECITALSSDCATDFAGCSDAGATFAEVAAPEDGGTCHVTSVLQNGTTLTFQVRFTVTRPATECCPATFEVDPPSMDIGGL